MAAWAAIVCSLLVGQRPCVVGSNLLAVGKGSKGFLIP